MSDARWDIGAYRDAHYLEVVTLENMWRQRVDAARYQSAWTTVRAAFPFLNDDVLSVIAAKLAAPSRQRILCVRTMGRGRYELLA